MFNINQNKIISNMIVLVFKSILLKTNFKSKNITPFIKFEKRNKNKKK